MKGKQLLYTIISVVFFGAAGVMIYVNFMAPKNTATVPPMSAAVPAGGSVVPGAPGAPGTTVPVVARPLLPYGTDMNFNIINTYNNGFIQPFQYDQVTPEQIGVIDHNLLVRPEGGG